MLFNNNQNSGKSQQQKNIIQGFKAPEDESIWSKADLHSDSKREEANWAKNFKDICKWPNTLCLHVLTGRVRAHKVCFKNYECYHCAYDQMIEDEDMDFLN